MSAPASYARRQFPGAASDTTLSAGINNSVTSCALASTSGWPTGAYTGGILCELYSTTTGLTAEKVWATDLTGSTLTIVRAADGTSATSHSSGTGIRPVAGAVDADEANKAVNETVGQISAAGQILVGDAANSMTALAAGTSGRILVGNGTTLASVAVSGDATLSAAGALSIGNSKITNAMMADDAVDSAEIADGAIDTVHIADDQVTLAKLAASAKPRWSTTFSTNTVIGGSATRMVHGPTDFIPYVAPEAGAIVGVSVGLESARTSGSVTFEVYVNGSGSGLTVTIDASNTQYHYATQAETADAFAAGDRIDVRYTDSSFAPATNVGATADVLMQAV